MVASFIQSLNETIDLNSKRIFAGLYSRIPAIVWIALFCLVLLGMGSIGYLSGLMATRRSPELLILATAFSIVLALIVALDRGYESWLRVDQQSIIDVSKMLDESTQVPNRR
jgi:hypothetical protein